MKELVAWSGGHMITKRWSMDMKMKMMVIEHLVMDEE